MLGKARGRLGRHQSPSSITNTPFSVSKRFCERDDENADGEWARYVERRGAARCQGMRTYVGCDVRPIATVIEPELATSVPTERSISRSSVPTQPNFAKITRSELTLHADLGASS